MKILLSPVHTQNVSTTVTNHEAALKHALIRYTMQIASRINADGTRMKKHEAIEALYGMIELCHEIGAVPILITTPLLNEYNDIIKQRDAKFYDDFYSLVHEISDKTGTRYYDYSHINIRKKYLQVYFRVLN